MLKDTLKKEETTCSLGFASVSIVAVTNSLKARDFKNILIIFQFYRSEVPCSLRIWTVSQGRFLLDDPADNPCQHFFSFSRALGPLLYLQSHHLAALRHFSPCHNFLSWEGSLLLGLEHLTAPDWMILTSLPISSHRA